LENPEKSKQLSQSSRSGNENLSEKVDSPWPGTDWVLSADDSALLPWLVFNVKTWLSDPEVTVDDVESELTSVTVVLRNEHSKPCF
jgi:hypothetical protein